MNKLMLTTALASSLLVSAAIAELKITGALEVTMGSSETPATGTKDQVGTTIGYENGLKLRGSKTLTNGTVLGVSANMNDSTIEGQALSFTTGGTTVYVGNDVNGGNLDDGQVVPAVANMAEDGNITLGISYNYNKATIHGADAIGAFTKTGVGTFSVGYAPKVAGAGAADSRPGSVASGSGLAVGFAGNLGVEGLTVRTSYTERDVGGLDSTEIDMTNIGASYNFGKVTVGAGQSTIDDTNNGTSYTAGGEYQARSIGLVFAATDAISVGYQRAELDINSSTTDEEVQSLTVGYNLGGATITAQWTEVENKAGVASTDGEAFELRIVQAY
ncbi:MAG: porin [Proteobacteria bacterium]|nr:porin [Pseudomonadota bacterium]